MRLESFESWLILREKELEEVNGMLLNERADLEKTEEFFEELDNNLQSKNLKLQNESQAIETAWHELEIERQRLHKWSLQLQNLGNQLKLKEHQLDCSIGALTERRKALKQYQKALEIRERTAMPSEYSPMNKLSRGVKYPYIESDSKDSELEMMESRIEFMESELSGEVISVLTPRSSVSSVAL
jgi:DNA mismatch repair ATPase MutS